ncbi:lactadherin-like [Branchiostoma floridae]|uniref:Lactadherin-like n=1 Tax=Branchiostoma floridae TaxID=7739 RepID=A0A9J7MWL3_BRAFL|nr:lactadherin-like [Branchiostoma floridae]
MENGTIEDGDITASSYYRYWPPWAARLDGDNACWRPSESNGSWIQVDLKDNKTVSGVITQGYDGFFDFNDYWITGYEVYYLSTSGSLEAVKDRYLSGNTFSGNTDLNGHKTNMFEEPIVTQVIRLYPTSWQRGPGLRMELLGCDFIASTAQSTTAIRTTPNVAASVTDFEAQNDPRGSLSVDTVDCSTDFRRFNDATFTVTCPAGCTSAFKLVWGTGAYTGIRSRISPLKYKYRVLQLTKGFGHFSLDSGICRAAIHDGRITDGGGQVTVYRWPGQDSYQGSTQNGIRTISSGRWPVSFAFTRVCRDALGMENGTIEDDDITASSHQNSRPPWAARLNGNGAWFPLFSRSSWIQVDLKQRKTVSGVITQGFAGSPQSWVTQYQVWYVNNDGKWAVVRSRRGSIMSFSGNTDPNGQKTNTFDRPIVAQKIQVYPTRWRTQIGLRVELLGCDLIDIYHSVNNCHKDDFCFTTYSTKYILSNRGVLLICNIINNR